MNYEPRTHRSFICAAVCEKVVQKGTIFRNFCSKSAHFCAFLTTFYTFFAIFYHFFLAYFAQTLQANIPTAVFTPKTNIPNLKKLKKPHFYQNSG